ncbi:T9SS type A sorting domain-containing protein [bacterium]|nr:T9SS type A sorting domain-containing protein [bacterium]
MKRALVGMSATVLLFVCSYGTVNAQSLHFSIERVEEFSGTSNTRLLIHPANHDLIAYNGDFAFRSSDQGVDWELDTLLNLPGDGALRISPADPSIVYGGRFSPLQRSNDGGCTFTETAPFPEGSGLHVWDIAIHPNDPSILYVGLDLTLVKSEDYGVTWTDLPSTASGLPTATLYKKLFIDPDTPSRVFVGTESGGLYRTIDDGSSWSYCGPGYSVGNLRDFHWIPNGDTVYQIENDGIYRSDNGGDTWICTDTLSAGNFHVIGVKADDAEVVFYVSSNGSGTYQLYRSIDGGSTFTDVHTFDSYISDFEFGCGSQYMFFTDPDDSDVMYLAAAFGIQWMSFMFKSTDAGVSWEYMKDGIYNFNINDICIANTGLLLSFEENYVYYNVLDMSTSAVHTYRVVESNWPTGRVVQDPNNPDYIWYTNIRGMTRITNNGATMTPIHQPGDAGTAVEALDVNGSTHIYYATYGLSKAPVLYKSTDGLLFNPVNIPANSSTITAILADRTDTDKIIMATDGNGYFITINGAVDWAHYTNPGTINDMAMDATDNYIIYFAACDALYKSVDGGETAVQIGSFHADCIVIDPEDHNTIYVSSGSHIFYSLDGGMTWSVFELLPGFERNLGRLILEFDPNNPDHLYVASQFYGLFLVTATPVGVDDKAENSVPAGFSLFQNYPNPFNPTTAIRYELLKDAKVALKIYNMLGQEVRTLVDEEQVAGCRSATWDGKNNVGQDVSSGIYICKLKTPDLVETKKLLLIR